jgi:hypothetical protein
MNSRLETMERAFCSIGSALTELLARIPAATPPVSPEYTQDSRMNPRDSSLLGAPEDFIPINPAPATSVVKSTSEHRDATGRLSLEQSSDGSPWFDRLTLTEQKIKAFFPSMILMQQASVDAEHPCNNKVVFPPALKIVKADHTVFEKLQHMQALLRSALVPYDDWAWRVSLELSGDFHRVALWTDMTQPTWTLSVEAII